MQVPGEMVRPETNPLDLAFLSPPYLPAGVRTTPWISSVLLGADIGLITRWSAGANLVLNPGSTGGC